MRRVRAKVTIEAVQQFISWAPQSLGWEEEKKRL
jgi:hypothetical protein